MWHASLPKRKYGCGGRLGENRFWRPVGEKLTSPIAFARVMGASFTRRRERIEPTDEWDQLILLFEWPGQREYEELRPLVLFGSSVAKRSRETGTPERTLYRKVERFDDEGPRGLFSAEGAKRQVLPPSIRH